MLKQLVKKQMAEIFRSYLYDAKKSQKRAKGTVILYFALFVFLMVGVLGGMFTFVAMMLAVLHPDGTGRHFHGCVRQRVQYLFQPVSGQG